MKKISMFLCTFLLIMGLAVAVEATPVTFEFTGLIDPGSYMGTANPIDVGNQTIHGTYTFESEYIMPPSPIGLAIYPQYIDETIGINANIGEFQLVSSGDFDIRVAHYPVYSEDTYRVNAGHGVSISNGSISFYNVGFFLDLYDRDLELLTSNYLPLLPPDISLASSTIWLSLLS